MADERRLSIVPADVTRDRTLSPTAKVVALAIGTCTNVAGECSAGNQHLCDLSGVPERTLRRCISALVDRGHLTQYRHARKPATLRWVVDMRGQQGGRSSDPKVSGQQGGRSPEHHERPKSHYERPNQGGMTGHRVAAQLHGGSSEVNRTEGNGRSKEREEQPKGTGGEPVLIRTKLTAFLTPPAADAADTATQAST